MKKSIKITGIVFGVAAIFGVGTYAGANTDWTTSAINSAYSGFLTIASDKTDELTSNTDRDIQNKIQSEIKGTVESQEAELKRKLEEYYQMKLNGFSETAEFKALEQQIEEIQNSVFESYKMKIDDAIVGKGK